MQMERARRANALAVKKDKDVHTLHPTPHTPSTFYPPPSTVCPRSRPVFVLGNTGARPLSVPGSTDLVPFCTRKYRSRPVFAPGNTGLVPFLYDGTPEHVPFVQGDKLTIEKDTDVRPRLRPVFVPRNTDLFPFLYQGIPEHVPFLLGQELIMDAHGAGCGRACPIFSHRMYQSNGFRKSTPPPNRQLIVSYCLLKQ